MPKQLVLQKEFECRGARWGEGGEKRGIKYCKSSTTDTGRCSATEGVQSAARKW